MAGVLSIRLLIPIAASMASTAAVEHSDYRQLSVSTRFQPADSEGLTDAIAVDLQIVSRAWTSGAPCGRGFGGSRSERAGEAAGGMTACHGRSPINACVCVANITPHCTMYASLSVRQRGRCRSPARVDDNSIRNRGNQRRVL
jgi:hypothetical protein